MQPECCFFSRFTKPRAAFIEIRVEVAGDVNEPLKKAQKFLTVNGMLVAISYLIP
jgi:hypothetical protein